MQNKAYYQLATISCIKKEYHEALNLVDCSINRNQRNIKSRNLKSIILRNLSKTQEAKSHTLETISIDILDYGARNELYLITQNEEHLHELIEIMRNEPNSYIELAIQYLDSGFSEDAKDILTRIAHLELNPLIHYYLGYIESSFDIACAKTLFNHADKMDAGVCFPNKLFTIKVLESAINLTPNLSKAYYYLGNLYYDKLISEKAITLWEKSMEIEPNFPTIHRNLGLAYYNKQQNPEKAINEFEIAYNLNKNDSRVFYELDQLYKRTNRSLQSRKSFIEDNYNQMLLRDDFYIEYIQVLNNLGMYDKALDLLLSRQFHVWEGGEGRVIEQYTYCLKQKAIIAYNNKNYQEAINLLEKAKVYPLNLGEGKLINIQENDINYYIGLCHQKLENKSIATEYFLKASMGTKEPTAAMFYNDAKPDSIYYQGLALLSLGNSKEAQNLFNRLIKYGEEHYADNVQIDYFAVSLPNFLIFEEDLQKSNIVHCDYLIGLGLLGTGKTDMAKEHFKKAQNNNINHQGIRAITNIIAL
jgi:tetratricopeptide (TPR) repeat protein